MTPVARPVKFHETVRFRPAKTVKRDDGRRDSAPPPADPCGFAVELGVGSEEKRNDGRHFARAAPTSKHPVDDLSWHDITIQSLKTAFQTALHHHSYGEIFSYTGWCPLFKELYTTEIVVLRLSISEENLDRKVKKRYLAIEKLK